MQGMRRGVLSGRKTYVLAAIGALAAVAAWAVGEPVLGVEAPDTAGLIRILFEAGLAVFLRMGIAKAEGDK